MTDSELTTIVDRVVSAILANSKSVMDLTPITSLGSGDYIEVSGGKRVEFTTIAEILSESFSEDLNDVHTKISNKTLASVTFERSGDKYNIVIRTNEKTVRQECPFASQSIEDSLADLDLRIFKFPLLGIVEASADVPLGSLTDLYWVTSIKQFQCHTEGSWAGQDVPAKSLLSDRAGNVYYYDGTDLVRLANGTEILHVNTELSRISSQKETMRFDGFQTVPVQVRNSGAVAPFLIRYYLPEKRFIAQRGTLYFDTFDGSDAYNSENGIQKDKLYICAGTVFVWDDVEQKLMSCAMEDEIAQLQDDIDYNTNNLEALADIVTDLSHSLWYGVEWDVTNSDPAVQRIGSMELHRTLPIQSAMRGCLLDDDGNVVEYLPADDWTNSTRDGSRGMVMVEIPEHYRRFETDGNIRRVKLSTLSLPGFHKVERCYVSAYEATIDRTISATPKLASVVNSTPEFRGGSNYADKDGTHRSFLGRPASSQSLTTYRRYARNRKQGEYKWNMYTYEIHKTITWLFVVEYATRNSQAEFISQPTSDGLRQGGLGSGATTFSNSMATSIFGGYVFIPCGISDSLGNRSGSIPYTYASADDPAAGTIDVARYRGIENPFGHNGKMVDGLVAYYPENNYYDGAYALVGSSPRFYNSEGEGYTQQPLQNGNAGGFITDIDFGENGDIFPLSVGGGSSNKFFCDRFSAWKSDNSQGFSQCLFGGHYFTSQDAGLFLLGCNDSVTHQGQRNSTRLTFIPNA